MVNINLPTHWSSETALEVHEFLDEILTQIQSVYSERLTEAAMEMQKDDTTDSMHCDEFGDEIDF